MSAMPSNEDFEFLRSIDTPTVCNLVEIVTPARRGAGYTVKHLHCPFPDLPPVVAFARTVTIKAKDAFGMGDAGYIQRRLDYLDYVAAEPRPSIMVIEDLDDEPGVGYVSLFYLAPQCRGQGLGRMLHEHAVKVFKARGLDRMRLSVASRNAAAIDFYRRLGWVDAGLRAHRLPMRRMEFALG